MAKVRAIMTSDVEVVSPDESIEGAARIMQSRGVGALPVCDQDRILGLVTDRDIAVRAIAEGVDPKRTRVRSILPLGGVQYCYEDQSLDEAARMMRDKQVRRLLVLDRDKTLVGLLSIDDLAVRGRKEGLTGRTLEGIAQKFVPEGMEHPISSRRRQVGPTFGVALGGVAIFALLRYLQTQTDFFSDINQKISSLRHEREEEEYPKASGI